ncbi:MAG TPA: putative motility protein [Tepidisphaeraceae bacterium]|jgi:hypothetical protein|nr:putative motility protein [Tepidisphaeraceae bacterium]
MDLTAVMSGIQTSKVNSQINIAVAKKMLDVQKQAGANVLQMLQAATTGPAAAGDALVAAATGLGGTIDAYA